MKSSLIAILLVLVSASTFADPAYKFHGDFVSVMDADGLPWACDDTSYTIVYNNGHPAGMLVAGKCWLPEEAALPDKAYSYDALETGLWCGCFLCPDESKFTVTPSGRVNFQCRVIEEE